MFKLDNAKFADGIRALFRKEQDDVDLDDELRWYMGFVFRYQMKEGLSRGQAMREGAWKREV